MKIYRPANVIDGQRDAYCRLTFANDADRARFGMGEDFRGQSLPADKLQPFHMKRSIDFPGGDANPLADKLPFAFNADIMVLSRRALDVLMPCIGHAVQLVPLIFDEGEYALVNVVNLLDALQPESSDIERFPSSDRISRIKQHAFKSDVVDGQWIFKIPQTPARTFVTDLFVALVQQQALTGFDFEPLWDAASMAPEVVG